MYAARRANSLGVPDLWPITSLGMEPNARRLWKLLEPIHAVGYFSPEPIALLKESGYRGYWMGYFAARSAPPPRAASKRPSGASLVSGLRSRGLVTSDGGSLTDAGRETKAGIESTTDALAATAYAALDSAEVEELITLLRPLTKAVVASGEIPGQSPMGLDLDDLDR